jgi:hypothetical protein
MLVLERFSHSVSLFHLQTGDLKVTLWHQMSVMGMKALAKQMKDWDVSFDYCPKMMM